MNGSPRPKSARIVVGEALRRCFENWNLTVPEAAHLMDVPLDVWERDGQVAMVATSDAIYSRACMILAVARALDSTMDASSAATWPKTANAEFEDTTPLDWMVRNGMWGIAAVRRRVDASATAKAEADRRVA